MLSTLAQIVVISFALVGVGFVLWLVRQFVGALGEARRELKQGAAITVEQPFVLAPYVESDGDVKMVRVELPQSVGEHERQCRSDIEKQVDDIYSKKELDSDQAESHI